MTRDGYIIIFPAFLLTLVLWMIYYFFPFGGWLFFAVLMSLFMLFNLWFFRDPDREFTGTENDIVSPADGQIVKIDKIFDDVYFKKEVTIVSIFLSVFNVHVNRWPMSGKIDFADYRKGKFLAAFNHKASAENEQTLFGISSPKGKILFKQIAGIIARRIIYHGKIGDGVERGDRFGMIRYGSRVDLLFDADVDIHVEMKQKVKCGETLIASFKTANQ